MGAWDEFSRCTNICGGGSMTRSRKQVRPASDGGQSCPAGDYYTVGSSTFQKQVRQCNTQPCSSLHTRYPMYEELANGEWWEMKFDSMDVPDTKPDMTAECRWQKNEPTGPWAFIPNAENIELDGTKEIIHGPGLGEEDENFKIQWSAGWN